MDFNMSRCEIVETKMGGPVRIFPSQRVWFREMWNHNRQTRCRAFAMYLHCLFGLITILLLIGCVTRVNLDYDEQMNFKEIQTFRMLASPPQKSGDVRLDTPLVDQRVRHAIENFLMTKD